MKNLRHRVPMVVSANFPCRLLWLLLLLPATLSAGVERVDIVSRKTLAAVGHDFTYEVIEGVLHMRLDPDHPGNAAITDLDRAPRNDDGMVEYTADFRLLRPSADIANGGLMYQVNNRGGSRVPPEISFDHPLAGLGFTWLATGWINEITPAPERLRLHAPIVGSADEPITGSVRYEIGVNSPADEVNVAGGGHLAYAPTERGLREASLTRWRYQEDARVPIERSRFELTVIDEPESSQPIVNLSLDDGFKPGVIYELVYEARDPVLAGAGMAAIRDLVSLIRHGGGEQLLSPLGLPAIAHTVAWGNSQSGRLLRQFLYDGFNADLQSRKVFDGIMPVIAGGGYGMFNNRFAMPTRTNGQHSNHLYPNDLFPFTYGESTDPWTGRNDSILRRARASGTVPMVFHTQTSNEYWVRAGSLPHTTPDGTEDAYLPPNVRFYTIGGSQHGSGNGRPRNDDNTQLLRNPNMWAPIADSLLLALYRWVAEGEEPPASRYPRIADGSLAPSHIEGRINGAVWNPLRGVNHPAALYRPARADYGPRWEGERIIDRHPQASDRWYGALAPAVDSDNNDFASSTILPPLTAVPLATFTPWNLRSPASGAERSLARLAGGYIPFPTNTAAAVQAGDPRNSIAGLYRSFEDYLEKYEASTDSLIEQGYLLPGFKQTYMDIADANSGVFE